MSKKRLITLGGSFLLSLSLIILIFNRFLVINQSINSILFCIACIILGLGGLCFLIILVIEIIIFLDKRIDFAYANPDLIQPDEKALTRLGFLAAFDEVKSQYHPIAELTPAEAGFLIDNKLGAKELLATFVYLAVKKLIVLTYSSDEKQYYFQPGIQQDTSSLDSASLFIYQNIQEALNSGLERIPLTSLSSDFIPLYIEWQEMVYQQLIDKGCLKSSELSFKEIIRDESLDGFSQHLKIFIALVVLVPIIIFLFIADFPSLIEEEQLLSTVGLILLISLAPILILIWLYFYRNIKYKKALSARGSYYRRLALGLQKNLKNSHWREQHKEDNLYFDELSPWAVAFGVTNKINQKFLEANIANRYIAYVH